MFTFFLKPSKNASDVWKNRKLIKKKDNGIRKIYFRKIWVCEPELNSTDFLDVELKREMFNFRFLFCSNLYSHFLVSSYRSNVVLDNARPNVWTFTTKSKLCATEITLTMQFFKFGDYLSKKKKNKTVCAAFFAFVQKLEPHWIYEEKSQIYLKNMRK